MGRRWRGQWVRRQKNGELPSFTPSFSRTSANELIHMLASSSPFTVWRGCSDVWPTSAELKPWKHSKRGSVTGTAVTGLYVHFSTVKGRYADFIKLLPYASEVSLITRSMFYCKHIRVSMHPEEGRKLESFREEPLKGRFGCPEFSCMQTYRDLYSLWTESGWGLVVSRPITLTNFTGR